VGFTERAFQLARPLILESEFKKLTQHYRKDFARHELREVAIALALRLDPGTVADLIESCGGKVFDSDIQEPEHVQRARELYIKGITTKNIGLISKARSLLRRFGVPEIYVRLATMIALGKCPVEL
jgi:hypothetical protein